MERKFLAEFDKVNQLSETIASKEKREHHERKTSFRFALIAAICGISGLAISVVALIISILAFVGA